MAVAGEQPHAFVVALDDQAVAVVLDFVNPVFRVRDLGAGRRNAGFKGGFMHAGYTPSRCLIHPTAQSSVGAKVTLVTLRPAADDQ